MSAQIIDQACDLSGKVQFRLTQLYNPPEFVKTAGHNQLHGDAETLQSHVYAWPLKKLFPCHTKAATWMSTLFYADQRNSVEPATAALIEQNLTKSAEYWQILPDVRALLTKVAEDSKLGLTKLADSDFALVWTAGGVKERHYPLRNATEVKTAATWFNQHRDEFNFDDKHLMATRILEKAAEFGCRLDDREILERLAGFGYCAAEAAAQAWEKRANLLRSTLPDYAAEAVKLASTIRTATFEARDQGRRVKMANLMEQFDQQTGLCKLYGQGLERPEDVLFQITEKTASDFLRDHVVTTNGAVYEKTALERLDIDTVRQWLGEDTADAFGGFSLDVEKMAEILPTLPRPDAEMFEKMTQASGIPVFAREKASAAQGFTLDELHELAKAYQPA